MRIHRLWALVVIGVLACSSDEPPNARIAFDTTFPSSALVRMQRVSLVPAGAGFILAGYEAGQVRWGRVSLDGVLTHETGFALASPTLGPYFTVTKKGEPADQLVALVLNPSGTEPGGYDLQAIVQDLDASTAAAPKVLATLTTGTDKDKVQIAAGAAKSGNLGFVAWGTKVQGIPIQYFLLGPDAVPTADKPAQAITAATPVEQPAWDCLAPTNGASGLGFSVVTPNPMESSGSIWTTMEMDETGARTGDMIFELPTHIKDCRIMGTPNANGGYNLAFENDPGIGVAFYYPPPPASDTGSIMTYPNVVPVGSTGAPINAPHPAWVSAAGSDVVMGLARPSGVQLLRYTYQSIPHGSSLVLRSKNGQIGPVTAWVGSDYTYVTYTDHVSGAAGASDILRYFTKVDAPARLP
jgi:hypothetical protein